MTNSQWVDEWMRAWQSFPDTGEGNPWTAMLEHFTKSHPAPSHQYFADALDRITEQSRAFFDLGQTLASHDGDGWQESMFKYFDELSAQLQDPKATARAFGGISPLDGWQRFAGHGNQSPQEHESLVSQYDKLLRMPGIGYAREHQESLGELTRLWLRCEQACSEYAAYHAETARRSVERLRERLQGDLVDGGRPASIRALYDAWVACSEEVYAERVATEEYMKLHGRMVNAAMAYRRQSGKIMDQWAKAANLPTREEVDALHRKLRDTRRQLRALEARTGATQNNKRKKKCAGKKRARKK